MFDHIDMNNRLTVFLNSQRRAAFYRNPVFQLRQYGRRRGNVVSNKDDSCIRVGWIERYNNVVAAPKSKSFQTNRFVQRSLHRAG